MSSRRSSTSSQSSTGGFGGKYGSEGEKVSVQVKNIRSPPSPDEATVLGEVEFVNPKSGETDTVSVKDTFGLDVITLPNGRKIVSIGGSSVSFYEGELKGNGLKKFVKRKGKKVFVSYQRYVEDEESENDVVEEVQEILDTILNGDVDPVPFSHKPRKKKAPKGKKGKNSSSPTLEELAKMVEFLTAKVTSLEKELFEVKSQL